MLDSIYALIAAIVDVPSTADIKESNQRPEVNLGIQTDDGKMRMTGQKEEPNAKKSKGKPIIPDPAKAKAVWPEDATNLRWIVVVLDQLKTYCDKKGCFRQSGAPATNFGQLLFLASGVRLYL